MDVGLTFYWLFTQSELNGGIEVIHCVIDGWNAWIGGSEDPVTLRVFVQQYHLS